jgi:hypothetical protein
MRSRLLRGLAAAALALAVVLPGTAQPAQATDGTDAVKRVGQITLNVLPQLSSGGLSPAQIAQLVRQVIDAVNQAEPAVIAHMDSLAAAPWLGQARHHILEFDDIEVFEEEVLWDWAQDVTGDAETAASVFNAVSNPKTADDLGYAIHTLYPIALTARAKAGFGTATLKVHYREALTSIVDKLKPRCTSRPGELDPHPSYYEVIHDCLTPNGSRVILRDYQANGVWIEGPYDAEALLTEAGKDTSWAVARAMLQLIGP